MKTTFRSILLASLFVFLTCTASHSQQYDSDGKWHYQFVPYIWFSGIDGDIAVRGTPASVDASFSDLAENLDFAFQFHFEGRKNEWGYFVDSTYINLSADGQTPDGTPADIDFTQWLVEFGGIYKLWSQCRNPDAKMSSLDLLFGGRYWNLSSDLNISGAGTVSEDQDWIDPFVGFSYTTDLSRLWGIYGRFDVGGFDVGSDFTWNLLLLLGYRTSPSGQLLFGYRILDVDRESGSGADFFRYDVTYSGPILGYSFNF